HFLLELHQARVGEIERNRNARHTIRTEPLARYPGVRPQSDAPLFELFMELVEAVLEPGPFNHDPQTAEPSPEQVLIGQRFPVVFSARPTASNQEISLAWMVGRELAGNHRAFAAWACQ